MEIFPVILAGGRGTRFWPASTNELPKQFLKLGIDGKSLIKMTADRVSAFADPKNLFVVTNQRHKSLVEEHLSEVNVIAEPCGRNTAPAIGLAAMLINEISKDAVMVVLPSDHVIQNTNEFERVIKKACEIAQEKNGLVTLGIEPTSPNTGYGYIKTAEEVNSGVGKVEKFVEKPNLETAKKYLADGGYFWNSGMFIWKAETIINSIKELMPELYTGLQVVAESLINDKNADISESFAKLPSESVDFGIMERAQDVYVVPAKELLWSDVGAWDAWADSQKTDENKNVCVGESLLLDSKNCVVYSSSKQIAIVGLDDVIVVDSPEGLLVCHRSKAQMVKQVVSSLEKKEVK